MVVIDDPTSILRCTNKIYLNDLMVLAQARGAAYRDPLSRGRQGHEGTSPAKLGFPLVLKIPDGSFSRGVVKVEDEEAAGARGGRSLFQHSALC